MAGRRLTYLYTLAVAVVFYLAYQQWLAYLLLLVMLGLPWLSLLLSLPGILTFQAGVRVPGAIPLGQSGRLRLEGTSLFPVPPFSGRLRVTRCVTGEQWLQRSGEILIAAHCGGCRIVPEKVRVYDYLGLFRFRVKYPAHVTTLVRPEPVAMDALTDLSRFLTRSWRPKPGGGFAENHELRLYRPGDSLNQVHWKLSAKMGKLIIREAMEPNLGLVLLTMDLRGTAAVLDRKFGQLLWLGSRLRQKNIPFEIRALTAEGLLSFPVKSDGDLSACIDRLLCCGPAAGGSVTDTAVAASWHHHIGGGSDEE